MAIYTFSCFGLTRKSFVEKDQATLVVLMKELQKSCMYNHWRGQINKKNMRIIIWTFSTLQLLHNWYLRTRGNHVSLIYFGTKVYADWIVCFSGVCYMHCMDPWSEIKFTWLDNNSIKLWHICQQVCSHQLSNARLMYKVKSLINIIDDSHPFT